MKSKIQFQSPSAPPQPEILEVNALENAAVEVKWRMPTDKFPGVIKGFIISFRAEGENSGINRQVDAETTSTTMTGLNESTSYFVTVIVMSSSNGQRSSETRVVKTTGEM